MSDCQEQHARLEEIKELFLQGIDCSQVVEDTIEILWKIL